MNVKDTNPKDAAGIRKVYFSTVPLAVFARAGIPLLSPVVAEAGLALLEGWCKYGRHNYRIAGVRASVYVDATLRHLTARALGQLIDPDSGLPHLVKAIASITVLCDAMMNGKWTDDRPPPLSAEGIGFLDLDEKEPDDNAVAAMLAAWWEGSGDLFEVLHDLSVMRQREYRGIDIVDHFVGLNAEAGRILDKYPNPKPPFTAVGMAPAIDRPI